jgi:hypothetical protein
MNKWRTVLLVIAVLGLSAPLASAQVPGISEITAYGGITLNGSDEPTAGIALTLNMTPQVGLEAEVGVIFADDEVIMLSGNAVLNLGTGISVIVPYITGGAGILKNGSTDIALNVGGGFKLFIEPAIAFRGDFRVFLTSESGDIEDLERFYAGVDFLF